MKKKQKARTKRLVIVLDEAHRAVLDKIKADTGASFAEIIRRMIIAREGVR
jgi:hypothetical protein